MVVLKKSVYSAVVSDISQFKGLSKHCKEFIEQKYPEIPSATVGSIISTQIQHKMRLNYKKSPAIDKKYYEEYIKYKAKEPPGVILRMSVRHKICPSLIARSILRHLNTDKRSFSALMKDTTLIEDRELAHEVYMTNLYDNEYGIFGNTIKQCIGLEYEQKLEMQLRALNISYIDENVLRSKGYDKTPDFKLIIPIAVDGFVINWIESKALFGDEVSHAGYLKDQFLRYWNRFGPGLVIYWLGYVEDIENTPEMNKMMILRDHFPEKECLTFMNPALLETVLPVDCKYV